MASVFEPVIPAAQQPMYDNFHFAPAVRTGDMLVLSGQIGFGSDGKVPEDLASQVTNAFEAIGMILGEAGLGFEHVIDITTYHVGDVAAHAQTTIEVKDRYIKEPYSAWTAVGVTGLAVPSALIEIKAVARVP